MRGNWRRAPQPHERNEKAKRPEVAFGLVGLSAIDIECMTTAFHWLHGYIWMTLALYCNVNLHDYLLKPTETQQSYAYS